MGCGGGVRAKPPGARQAAECFDGVACVEDGGPGPESPPGLEPAGLPNLLEACSPRCGPLALGLAAAPAAQGACWRGGLGREAAGPPETEGDGAGGGGSSSSSSCGSPVAGPEQLWVKQARRLRRQQSRRRRAAEGGRPAQLRGCLDASYALHERLGGGGYSSVSRCVHLASGEERALKSVDKRRVPRAGGAQQEIEIMRSLGEGGGLAPVVRLHEAFEDSKCVHIVMELCRGGELSEHLALSGAHGLPERLAAAAMRQVAAAVAFLHSRGVAHRDLKPDNMMLTEHGDLERVALKLIDFGLSRRFEAGVPMRTLACTPQYVAPEVLAGAYTEACDLWSAGVVLYVLLCGSPPFNGDSDAQVFARVRSGHFDFAPAAWERVGAPAVELVRRLLAVDAAARPTAARLLREPWVAPQAAPPDSGAEPLGEPTSPGLPARPRPRPAS